MSAAARLIIVGGPPASGKSTLASRLAEEHDAILLSPDDWLSVLGEDLGDAATRDRVEELQWTLARDLLTRSLAVVLDWGAFTAGKRERLRLGARELGASVALHFLDAPRDVLWERVVRRAADGGQPPPTRDDFEAMLDDVQVPDAAERARFDAC